MSYFPSALVPNPQHQSSQINTRNPVFSSPEHSYERVQHLLTQLSVQPGGASACSDISLENISPNFVLPSQTMPNINGSGDECDLNVREQQQKAAELLKAVYKNDLESINNMVRFFGV